MNIFGIYKGDGFVVFADQDMSNSAIDYFADKPEYETSKYLTVIQQKFNEAVITVIQQKFNEAVKALGEGVIYGYLFVNGSTILITASTEKKKGYKYPEDCERFFSSVYIVGKSERVKTIYGKAKAMGNGRTIQSASIAMGSNSSGAAEGSVNKPGDPGTNGNSGYPRQL